MKTQHVNLIVLCVLVAAGGSLLLPGIAGAQAPAPQVYGHLDVAQNGMVFQVCSSAEVWAVWADKVGDLANPGNVGMYVRLDQPEVARDMPDKPLLTGIAGWRQVAGCPRQPSVPRPMRADCAGRVYLTVNELPPDWQGAVIAAGQTWTSAGSRLHFVPTVLSDGQRSILPVDAFGNLIEQYPLARCEVRVVLGSSLPPANKQGNGQNAGWQLSYPDLLDPSHAVASFVVLNDEAVGPTGARVEWSANDLPTDPTKLDVQTVALHELGHSLGFPDVPQNDTVMRGQGVDHILQLLGVKLRSLTPRDVNALIATYGR